MIQSEKEICTQLNPFRRNGITFLTKSNLGILFLPLETTAVTFRKRETKVKVFPCRVVSIISRLSCFAVVVTPLQSHPQAKESS